MGLGTSLRELGRFLDACEGRDAVTDVQFSGTDADRGAVVARIELAFEPGERAALEGGETSLGADGTLNVSFQSATPVLPVADHDVDLDPVSATLDATGTTRIELLASVPLAPGGSDRPDERETHDVPPESAVTISVGRSNGPEAASAANAEEEPAQSRSRDVPPFRDRELLQEVYESCDTFAEMPEALGMDVTAETVRRYMIRQGIHEPKSYDTSSSDEAEETPARTEPELDPPAVLADGIGLPDDVDVDTIVEVVQTSNTIYEVKEGIGVDREDVLEMLRELNLLEFVAGRLATEAEREVSREQIIGRLREQADAM
jgi:hypothetical protein